MELQDYLRVLRKRWVSIVAITALCALGAVGASLAMTPVYQATTQLYVSVQGGASTSDLLQGANFTRQQVTSYAQLVNSPSVLGPVIDDMGLDVRAESLAGRVQADSPLNTSLINVTVTDENPAVAAATADAIAGQFKDVIGELETPADGGPSAVKVSVVREATAPTDPSSPNLKLNLALGLLVGLALGVGIAVLREVLDTRVRTEDDIARVTETSVIGTIPYDEDAPKHPLIVQSSPHSHRAEAFRRVRTNLQFLDVADRPRSIVITSSLPGEGKSTTSINVAITLADAGTRVVLVDADLRRPAVARYMGLEGGVGLTTALIGRADVTDVIQPWGNGNLHVLPAGQVPPNPSELLGSQAMAQLLATLTSRYDVVLLDTAPLLPVTDAAILAKLTGGALLVAGSDKLHRNQLAESLSSLETVGARVLGIVLNRQRRKAGEQYTYYDYSPTPAVDGRARNGRRRKARSGPSAPATTPTPATTTGAVPVSTNTGSIWPGDALSESRLRGAAPTQPQPQHQRGGPRA
ncbi:polysaccharide biosynthesis tyrosine autokinase [Cellulomonas sp. H30R-01]|uniref:non-specific protein-tyrosine kinase n=1 Tax=Cellulomonas algicola TaxID=2071633 RepID=A0A401UV75_9CELL|nr:MULTISPECIES: polysaccharide biosynthesis tyrosine autokinase [Cellulomonas]QHT56887.1 polysaccharide biosynthesis tyrosine autokinase [Cellulomonas sp. H30R-01]GCD18577.1 chromosome partitioning protein [Cellulomonas algicola]